MAATVTVGPAVTGGRCIAWVDGASAMPCSVHSACNVLDGTLVDGIQGHTDRAGPIRDRHLMFGLAGHFLEGDVRLIRRW